MPDDDTISSSKQEGTVIDKTINCSQEYLFLDLAYFDSQSTISTMAQNEEVSQQQALQIVPRSSTRWCPSCFQTGRQVKLRLCQNNLEEAMYICTAEKCLYPFGDSGFETNFVNRHFSHMNMKSNVKKKKHYLKLQSTSNPLAITANSQQHHPLSAEEIENTYLPTTYSTKIPEIKQEPESLAFNDAFFNDLFNKSFSNEHNFKEISDPNSSASKADEIKTSSISDNRDSALLCLPKDNSTSFSNRLMLDSNKNFAGDNIVQQKFFDSLSTIKPDNLQSDKSQNSFVTSPDEGSRDFDHPTLKVDLEMLTQACKVLKSPPVESELSLVPKQSTLKPLKFNSNRTEILTSRVSTCNSSAVLPLSHRSLNTSLAPAKRKPSNPMPSDFYYKDVPKRRHRSKLSCHITFEPLSRKRVFRLTGQRKANLNLIRETSRVRGASSSFSTQSVGEETSSLASSDKSSELSGLSDLLPDLDVFSNTELNDLISDADFYNEL